MPICWGGGGGVPPPPPPDQPVGVRKQLIINNYFLPKIYNNYLYVGFMLNNVKT